MESADKKAEWIVIDLKRVIVHIFDPQIRSEINLDGKLEAEMTLMKSEDDPTDFMNKLFNSLPALSLADRIFIEKFRMSKDKKQKSTINPM